MGAQLAAAGSAWVGWAHTRTLWLCPAVPAGSEPAVPALTAGFVPLQGCPEAVWSCRAAPARHGDQRGSDELCSPGAAQTVCPPGPGAIRSISLLIAALLRPDLLLLALRNLCHLYSVPSLNLQYTFCFSSHQPLSPPSTLMQDMCGIHLGFYLKTISHPGFNTFPHQGGAKLHLNEN